MRTLKQFAPAIAAALLAHAWLAPGISNAGPIYEWWMARRAARQPQVIAYQSPAISMQACCDASACGACNTGCDSCGAGYAQTTVANYAPTTAYSPTVAYSPITTTARQTGIRGFFSRYRTAWTRVPVTSYRPVASIDPNTGASVTVLQPCTTYTWQLARVPVSTLRPTAYAVAYAPQATATSSGYYSAATVAQPAIGSGCASCATGGATYAAPSSAPYAAPSTGGPTYAAPASPSAAPAVPAGPAGSVGPAETAPADRPPSLNPDGLNQGASFRTAPRGKAAAPQQSVRVDRPRPKFEIGSGIKPVPDPDAPQQRTTEEEDRDEGRDEGRDDDDAVELHNPRDRTAAMPQRRTWAFQPVSWSRTHVDGSPDSAAAAAVHETPVATTPSSADEWDASGWKSIRN